MIIHQRLPGSVERVTKILSNHAYDSTSTSSSKTTTSSPSAAAAGFTALPPRSANSSPNSHTPLFTSSPSGNSSDSDDDDDKGSRLHSLASQRLRAAAEAAAEEVRKQEARRRKYYCRRLQGELVSSATAGPVSMTTASEVAGAAAGAAGGASFGGQVDEVAASYLDAAAHQEFMALIAQGDASTGRPRDSPGGGSTASDCGDDDCYSLRELLYGNHRSSSSGSAVTTITTTPERNCSGGGAAVVGSSSATSTFEPWAATAATPVSPFAAISVSLAALTTAAADEVSSPRPQASPSMPTGTAAATTRTADTVTAAATTAVTTASWAPTRAAIYPVFRQAIRDAGWSCGLGVTRAFCRDLAARLRHQFHQQPDSNVAGGEAHGLAAVAVSCGYGLELVAPAHGCVGPATTAAAGVVKHTRLVWPGAFFWDSAEIHVYFVRQDCATDLVVRPAAAGGTGGGVWAVDGVCEAVDVESGGVRLLGEGRNAGSSPPSGAAHQHYHHHHHQHQASFMLEEDVAVQMMATVP